MRKRLLLRNRVRFRSKSRDYYEEVFKTLSKDFPVIAVDYAYCHRDATARVDSESIYHLAIIDLRLPKNAGEPPIEGIDLGQDIVKRCSDRHAFPIPAAL